MKRIVLLFAFALVTGSGFGSSNYHLDESKVEDIFNSSKDITGEIVVALNSGAYLHNFMFNGCSSPAESDKQTTAGIIAIAQFVTGTGFIPIYRFMLGTGGKNGTVFGLYCVTCGGLGLLPLIDAIMLLTDDSGNKYVGSGKFLMWLE
jgi:TM2 domain-containing membrane protein YozV